MIAKTRRAKIGLATAGALALGATATYLVLQTDAPQRSSQSSGQSRSSAELAPPMEGPAPIAVPTAAAPSSLAVEPGPTDVVATDEPVPVTGGQVQVVIGYADWNASADQVEAAGYVSGVVENGGTCTLVLVRGDRRLEVEVPAEADASTTTCGALQVPGDQVVPGEWTATLDYTSGTSRGTSAPATVTVQR